MWGKNKNVVLFPSSKANLHSSTPRTKGGELYLLERKTLWSRKFAKKENGRLLSELSRRYSMKSESNTSTSKLAKIAREPISANRSWLLFSFILLLFRQIYKSSFKNELNFTDFIRLQITNKLKSIFG